VVEFISASDRIPSGSKFEPFRLAKKNGRDWASRSASPTSLDCHSIILLCCLTSMDEIKDAPLPPGMVPSDSREDLRELCLEKKDKGILTEV